MAGDLKNLPRIPDNITAQVPLAEVMHKRLDQLTRLHEESEARAEAREEAAHEWRNRIERNLDAMVEQMKSFALATEARLGSHSLQVKNESKTNLDQSSEIASVIVSVQEVKATQEEMKLSQEELKKSQKAQTEMLTTLVKHGADFLSSPKGKALTWAFWVLVVGWFASKGITVPR